MTTVVGVRFREVGKIYYFDPGELKLNPGDNVIVDTVRGTEFGTVMIGNRQVEDEDIVQPLKIVRRAATADDVERVLRNREKEKDAFRICKEKIRERGLEMKLISAEYTFDNAKILFYFTADGRIDFRELVKDLASVFKIRIELRQVGVRDETKLMGGLGGCGRPLCCASYLSDFVPVSIRMAKEQNLSLNPQKISGVCGRLMCCLKNEADTYEDLNTRLPKDGGKVITPDGREGVAETVNVLRERVRVLFTDEQGNREMEEFAAAELKFTPRRKTRALDKTPECPERMHSDASIDETVDELIDEVRNEEDSELRSLEIAEIAEIGEAYGPEKTTAGETERSEGSEQSGEEGKNPRRRHRRHRSNHVNASVTEADEKKEEKAEQPADSKTPDGETPHHRHRHHHRRRTDGNGGQNGEQQVRQDGGQTGSGAEERHKRRPENNNSQPGENSENGEHRSNGAHRRFRKRRPKNNPES